MEGRRGPESCAQGRDRRGDETAHPLGLGTGETQARPPGWRGGEEARTWPRASAAHGCQQRCCGASGGGDKEADVGGGDGGGRRVRDSTLAALLCAGSRCRLGPPADAGAGSGGLTPTSQRPALQRRKWRLSRTWLTQLPQGSLLFLWPKELGAPCRLPKASPPVPRAQTNQGWLSGMRSSVTIGPRAPLASAPSAQGTRG